MPKYVIERTVPGAGQLSSDQLRQLAQHSNEVIRDLSPDLQWVHSYVAGDKIYCLYNARDAELIREHARCGGFPADHITAVDAVIDPTTRGTMTTKAVISGTTGVEDAEKVTVALLVAVGAAQSGRPT